MQKTANRILSALIVLVMIVSMLPATVFATGETEEVLTGWNVVLGENIGVNFHLNKSGYTVSTTVSGVEVTPVISGSVVTVNVSAAQMTDTIGLTVKDGETVVKEGKYSVRQYAETILTGEYDDYVKQLVKEMLNYGAAAQTYFAHNTGNPANKDYEQDPTATVPSEVPAISTTGTLPAGLTLYGMTLIFQSRTAVRFYFKTTGDIANYTFKVDGTEYTPVQKQGTYYIEVGNINPQNLHQSVTVSVNDGAFTVSYSPLDYIVRQYSKTENANLKALVEAMYCYHRQARYYVGMIPVGVLQANVNGHGAYGEGIYFSTQETNDAPYGANGAWEIYYDSASIDCLKLVRGGETISVGLTGKNTICKFTANDYALRLYDHTIGDYAPFTTDDMFIIEGAFTHQDSMTTLNIEKTYIYYDGSAWVFSAEEPVFEPETESPFTFDKGVFSADIFNNRNNGLSVSVENKQLKLQQPEGASNWLWIKQDMPAGTVVTMDVTFSGDGMNLFGYGSNAAGDPITGGAVTEPAAWYNGQGGSTSGSYTFNIYEDCYGLSLMLGFANSTETAIYIDNVTIILPPETESPFTFDCGSFSADIFNNRNNGLSVSVENKQLKLQQPEGASNWLWIKQDMKAGTTVTMDVTFSGEGMSLFGYGSNANGDPIVDGTVTESVPQGWFWGQGGSTSGSYTFNIYEDCYGLSLMLGFANSTETAIYIDNVVITPPSEIVVNGGNMTENADSWDAAGEIYFTLAENDVPVDENAETQYTAESGEIKLVRGGSEYAMVGTVVKYGDTSYYLDLSGSENLPLQDNDYLIVEGNFVNADNGYTLNIAKTYVLVDGENLIYSTTEPVIVSTYEVGVLAAHGSGVGTGDNGIKGIYATSIATGATSGSWSIEYSPVAAENYKLIRDGVTYNVGKPGEGTLVMFGQTEYYLKQESNTFDSSLLPLQKGDVLVVEGNWSCNQDAASVINIDTTYILVVGESAVKFSAEMPNIVKISVLKESQNARADSGFYATADSNSAPLNGDWSLRYVAQSADAVKYVSGGNTTNVAGDGEMIAKFSETDYWFEGSTLSGTYANIAEGDMYIVDGLFYNAANNVYIDIDTTYIKFTASDELFGSTEMDATPAYEMGVLSTHTAGVRVTNGSIDGIYATGAAGTGAAYGTDWKCDYAPVRAENFKLIRDGVPYNVGVPATRTLVMFEDGQLFLDINANTFADTSLLPLQEYDVLVLEGKFYCQQDTNSVINITTTYMLLGDGYATFSATMPEVIKPYEVGVLTSHSAGVNVDATVGIKGIYATCTATDATCGATTDDWSIEYTPVSTENYKLIRGGTTYNVGQVGAGTLVLYSPTDIYLKQESQTVGDGSLLPLQDGDILVVEGKWRCNQDTSSVINITTTYITVSATNSSAVFSATDPRIINVGTMYTHEAGYSTSSDGNISGIYFRNDANAVPYDNWDVRYAATDASNVKLIRNGATTNIAVVGANTIVKLNEQDGWLCLESSSIISTYPIVAGDVLIVEGAFTNASNGYTMVIDKTYIIVGENGAVTFTTHYEQTDDFGVIVLPTVRDTLTFGTWAGSYHHFTDERLAELKNAGITKILGVSPTLVGSENNNDVSVLLDRCAKYGISIVVDLRDWDGSTVPAYANHPNLIGFLMSDEPNTSKFEELAALKTKFDAVMPADKLFYVNLFPEYADDGSLGELTWWDELVGTDLDYDEEYITAFLNAMDIEVLSWDNYSLIIDTEDTNTKGIRTDYFHNFEVMASKNVPLWYTMLSSGHSTTSTTAYATPTAEELRWQMAVAMTYGVQNIDHYVYCSHESGYSCMVEYEDADGDGTSWETNALYYDIQAVDNEYLSWDHIFMAYDWKGVAGVKAGSSSTMLGTLENNIDLTANGLTSVSTTQDVLVGVFDHNGDKAYMVTNAGSAGSTDVGDGKNFTMTDATVTLNLAAGTYKCVAVIDNGEIRYVAVENNTVTIPVSAYEGVFVIPVLN